MSKGDGPRPCFGCLDPLSMRSPFHTSKSSDGSAAAAASAASAWASGPSSTRLPKAGHPRMKSQPYCSIRQTRTAPAGQVPKMRFSGLQDGEGRCRIERPG